MVGAGVLHQKSTVLAAPSNLHPAYRFFENEAPKLRNFWTLYSLLRSALWQRTLWQSIHREYMLVG